MFKQKKYQFEILESLEEKLNEYISSADADISRYSEELSAIDKNENPWDYDWRSQTLEAANARKKAAENILKTLEKTFG